MSQKRLSLRQLPGKDYFNTLINCLEFVEKNNPDRTSLRKWFADKYHLTGKMVIDACIKIAEVSFGLLQEENGKLSLTNEGKTILETKDKGKLFEILNGRIVGISEILDLLKPYTLSELHGALLQRLAPQGAKWTKEHQTRIRVRWLINLGMVSKSGPFLDLTKIGRSKIGIDS